MSLGCFGEEVGAGVLLSLGFGVECPPGSAGRSFSRESRCQETAGSCSRGKARKSGAKSK